MNTIKLSAALTAAVLAGALSTAVYAADAERPASRITVSGGSIILKKAINLDKAPGAGGIKGMITFNVAAGQDDDLPQAHTADEMLGTADQLASTTATAEFTADAQGKANTESNVTVDFNMDKFTKHQEAGKIQLIREYGQLLSEEYTDTGILVKARVPQEIHGKLM